MNPFEYMADLATREQTNGRSVLEFQKKFSLSACEAKIIWLACPEYQENICRQRILSSKASSGSEYGNKNWPRRRFEFSADDVEEVFDEIWNSVKTEQSRTFLSIVTQEVIAKTRFTENAQAELVRLMQKYSPKTE